MNDNGGINGHPVRVITLDSNNDPTVAQSMIEETLAEENVIAMVAMNDQNIQAWWPSFEESGIPAIGGMCYTIMLVCSGEGASPLYFSSQVTVPALTQGALVSGQLAGATTFAGVVCAEIPACAQVEAIYEGSAEAVGLEYAGIVTVAASAPDYTAECLSLQERGVDYAQLSTAEGVALRMVDDCATQGYTPTWDMTGGSAAQENWDAITAATGGMVSGALEGFPWWVDDPQVQAMRDAFAEYAPDAIYESSQVTAAWSSFELFRKAMENASDDPTAEEVIDAMLALEDEDLGGLLAQSLNFAEGEPAPIPSCFWTYQFTEADGPTLVGSDNPSGNSVAEGDLKSECFPPLEG